MSDISKTIRDKGFVSFYCQVSVTGPVGWASSMLMPRLFPYVKDKAMYHIICVKQAIDLCND